jgi:TonB-dependent receptor
MKRWSTLLVFAIGALLGGPLRAQSPTGTITGRVFGEGDRPLPGAVIQIEGSQQSALTNERGTFSIAGVPAGRHQIRVTLIGFQTTTVEVNVTAGQTVTADIALQISPLALEEIIVRGQVGQAEAYNRQRTAVSVRNVVSAEQIERFPDAQVPDALRRIPGVSSMADRGETGYVLIRGLSPKLSSVTVNGARIPSTDPTTRGVELSSIPSEMLSSIEVVKAITPDMDADAVAGSIDLGMRRPTRRQFDGRIEGGMHSLTDNRAHRAGLTFADVVGRFGYMVGGDYASQPRENDYMQYTWGTWQNQQVLNRLIVQHYPIERTKYSANTSLSYNLSDESFLYLRGFYSAYDTREERHRMQYRFDQGTRQSVTDVTNGRLTRQARQYKWERRIWNVTAGGEHQLSNGMRLDYYGTTSLASRHEPYRDYIEGRQTGLNLFADAANRLRPDIRVTNDRNPNDLSAFTVLSFEQRLDFADDRDLGAGANLTVPFTLSSGHQGSFRFGGKFATRDKERDAFNAVYDKVTGTFNMGQLGNGGARMVNGRYTFGPDVVWSKTMDFWKTNRTAFADNPNVTATSAESEDYEAGEVLKAAYGMGTFDLGAFQVIAGARYEHVANDYMGKQLIFDKSGNYVATSRHQTKSGNGSFFPALHLRYRVDEQTNLRFAATRTISRPDFLDMAPTEIIRHDEERIRRGNPELRPATSFNLDLLAERYLGSVGVVSGAFFMKEIRDFAFTSLLTEAGGDFAGYEVRRPENGAKATVYGAEVSLHRRLNFLPGALDGLGFFANYTYTTSDTDFGAGSRTLPFPEQIKHVGNVALTFDRWGFSGLVSAHHQGRFLYTVGSGPETDRWHERRTQLDASASQRIGPRLRATLQLNNLTDAPYTRYDGTPNTPYATEREGRWGSLGLRFNL